MKMPMSLRTLFIKEFEQKIHKALWGYMKDFCFVVYFQVITQGFPPKEKP